MYGGPKRPREQVAIIKSGYNTQLKAVDRRSVEGLGQKLEVLPGLHSVTFIVHRTDQYVLYKVRRWTRPTTICFFAKAGHEYAIDQKHDDDLSSYEIIDNHTGREFDVRCADPDDPPARDE
jgi:hypothetical protein